MNSAMNTAAMNMAMNTAYRMNKAMNLAAMLNSTRLAMATHPSANIFEMILVGNSTSMNTVVEIAFREKKFLLRV